MELRVNPQKRAQYQQELLKNRLGEEKKRKQKLFIIYFSAGISIMALILIGFVAYKIAYAPVEYQSVSSPPTVKSEPVKPAGPQVTVEGKTYDDVQAFLDRDAEPPVPIPRDDLPAGTVAE